MSFCKILFTFAAVMYFLKSKLMKNLLFPNFFKPIGWIVFIPALILGSLLFFNLLSFDGVAGTIVNDLAIIGIVLGSLFIVCSKERVEDEMTRSIRLASLLNSIYVYVALLICCTIFINGTEFLVFAVLNLVILPILFVFNFRMEIYRYNKMCEDEEQD